MKKVFILSIFLSLCLFITCCLSGCASEEDKSYAANFMARIDSIGEVTLEKAEDINNIYTEYKNMTRAQKWLVKNHEILEQSITQLFDLARDEQAKKDPTFFLREKDLQGVWRQGNQYLYFSSMRVAYMVSYKPVDSSSFKSEHFITEHSYSLGSYDYENKIKEGSFKIDVLSPSSICNFSVSVSSSGKATMVVTGNSTVSGTYTKQIDTHSDSSQPCQHNGCENIAVSSGDSVYCETHSNLCLECGCYIDEDALLCLSCIVKALEK